MIRILATGLLAAACSCWGATCRATTCEAIAPVTILPVDGTCPGWGLDGEIRTASTLEELMGIIDGGAILYGNHGFVSAAFQNYLGAIAGQPVAASVNLFNQGTGAQAGELFDDPQSGSGTAVTDWTGSGEARTLVGFGTTSFQFHEECFYVSILVVSAEGEALTAARCLADGICVLIRGAVPARQWSWGSIKMGFR